jgi:Zn-dependent protease with chaperone function
VTEFEAAYYDGKSSARRSVHVRSYPGTLEIVGEGLRLEVSLQDIQVDPPIGATLRALHLPDGAELQTDDHAAVEELFPNASRFERWVNVLERSWAYALGGLVLLVLVAWWAVTDGLPRAAKAAARYVPPEVEVKLGDQALRGIDGRLCKPTALGAARRQQLREAFATITAGLDGGYRYRLELRKCGTMGPNAFALPGGAVVLTDELVELAENDAQISAVLAHEIGHVRHRHGLRIALQAAGLGALASALTGDATSITSLAVTVPTLLLQNGYSRGFEQEADDYAFQRLKEVGLSPRSFAEIISLLESQRTAGRWTGYLSTHPASASRIERAIAAASR